MAKKKIEIEENRDATPFDIFVIQHRRSAWTEGMTPEQARDMLKTLIASEIPGEIVEIPTEVLSAYSKMHWAFPGVVCSVHNFKGKFEAHFEYFEKCPEEEAHWRVTVSRGPREFIGRALVECFTTDVVATLIQLTEVIHNL